MKRIIFIIPVALGLLFFTGCSKEKNHKSLNCSGNINNQYVGSFKSNNIPNGITGFNSDPLGIALYNNGQSANSIITTVSISANSCDTIVVDNIAGLGIQVRGADPGAVVGVPTGNYIINNYALTYSGRTYITSGTITITSPQQITVTLGFFYLGATVGSAGYTGQRQ